MANFFGTSGDDPITGTSEIDFISGMGGNDVLNGADGADVLLGGDGDDLLEGGFGADMLYGGDGNDVLRPFGVFAGFDGDAFADGGAGVDFLDFSRSFTVVVDLANGFVRKLNSGTNAADTARIVGVENVAGSQGADILFGDSQGNALLGLAGDDILLGHGGDDILVGGEGNDYIEGGLGDDYIDGFNGSDRVFGGDGSDNVHGWSGDDLVDGGSGDDKLYGEDGADVLIGGAGADELYGGPGADRFVYTSPNDSRSAARDLITDFDSSIDLIDVSQVDADSSAAGNQDFAFVSAFSGQAGQAVLTFEAGSNLTRFDGDVDGDGFSDFSFLIGGNVDGSRGFAGAARAASPAAAESADEPEHLPKPDQEALAALGLDVLMGRPQAFWGGPHCGWTDSFLF